jgi:oxalate decarboxylase/phosphoglucose isomerase-like protein (cupin superfamily)
MDAVHLIELPKILDPRGNLTFAQNGDQLPFPIKRVFWTYDVQGGAVRGGHAYRQQEEVMIALSGSFEVVITEPGGAQRRFFLNRSYCGLYLPPLTWRHVENFSTNTLIFHLASTAFSKEDYIYDFDVFIKNSPPDADHP